MQEKVWHYHRKVSAQWHQHSLRQLLSQDWLIPKYLIRALRTNQQVLVNHQYQPVNSLIAENDQIDLTFTAADFPHLPHPITPDFSTLVSIAYEDDTLLIINKRRGDKTHPNQPQEVGSTLNFVAAYLNTKNEAPYMVHRLDMATSGALIVAKSPAVVPLLNRQISNKIIQRQYLTWVHGTDLPRTGTITLPIGRDLLDKRKRIVNGFKAQAATTHYQVLTQNQERSLLKVELATGRTHQIRVHLAAIGHPLIGDPLYSLDPSSQAMLLHSWQVQFSLPFSDTWQTITVAPPADFWQ